MIERLAPNTAALDTPNVEGDAIELPSVDCMMRPATDSPAPAMTAAMILGILMFQTILLYALELFMNNAFQASANVMLLEPIKTLRKIQISRTAVEIQRNKTLAFVFLM